MIRPTRETLPWPVLSMLLAGLLIPTGCVLWLLNAAISNERLAVREKLMRAYAVHLQDADSLANAYFKRIAGQVAGVGDLAPPARFAAIAGLGVSDSALIFSSGTVIYPDTHRVGSPRMPANPEWKRAEHLEHFQGSPAVAAELYRALAEDESRPAHDRARAIQAAARCMEKTGDIAGALAVLERVLDDGGLANARDTEGRLVALGGVLRCMERAGRDTALFNRARAHLSERLLDYSTPAMPASQRRFLAREFIALSPDDAMARSLLAEELAAKSLANSAAFPDSDGVFPISGACWGWRIPNAETMLLFNDGTLKTALEDLVRMRFAGLDPQPKILAPDVTANDSDFVAREDAGTYLPGWRWVIRFDGENPFASAADRQVLVYAWTALLVLLAAAVLMLLAGRRIARHLRVARMKNELIAVVSHELKTPLASMRAIVDTILEGRCPEPLQQTEYLRLIAKENARLTRLIDNFLAFSRMEQDRSLFNIAPVDVNKVVAECAEIVRDRLAAADFAFALECAPGLPLAEADPGALTTAVLNLLDNAVKYSDASRNIALATRLHKGMVAVSVTDQGIGMSKRETRRAFERFYQADNTLHRAAGGCGLGLSIVKFIMDAHGGEVGVESAPGRGSTFTLRFRAHNETGSTT